MRKINLIDWFRDDVSWAITIVGIVLIVYTIASLIVLKTCEQNVVMTGITGIVALARGNGKAKEGKESQNGQ